MNYEMIDHTADFGIRVWGRDVRELFRNSALATMDLITEYHELRGQQTRTIRVEGDDWEDLMVNWLREILFLWNGEEYLVKETNITDISEYKMESYITGDPYDPNIHSIKNEIKAVTYHQIQVISGKTGWEAAIIFDG